eukprot:COSAG06_NODE_34775_length_469_cov_1.583784_1_plen_52_part_01
MRHMFDWWWLAVCARCFSGAIDQMSLHGGCPVLAGEKWAANKWVWNSPKIM